MISSRNSSNETEKQSLKEMQEFYKVRNVVLETENGEKWE